MFIRPLFLIPILLISIKCFSQKHSNSFHKDKFFISAGYGLAGGFFVTGYDESLPFPSAQYAAFYNKNFIGNSQNFSIGMRAGKNYELKVGLNYQHFSRRVKVNDTLSSVVISLDNNINHRDYMYCFSVDRRFENKKNLLLAGLGIYYIRPQAETIEYGIGIPNFYVDREANYQNSKEEEAGAFVEFSYEYKFQPRVNLGIRTQFYYTISVAEAESITLFPYIKILF